MTDSPRLLIVRRAVIVMALALLFFGGCWLWFPFDYSSVARARAPHCRNKLRIIRLALEIYHDDWGTYPPAHFADEDGRPMHSWRVLLLPYLNRAPLYSRYRFDEPWDGPNNSQLHEEFVNEYWCPSDSEPDARSYSYFAVIGPETHWPPGNAAKRSEFTDLRRQTIALVEVANSKIHWMQPVDIEYSQLDSSPWPPIGERASHTDKGLFLDSAPYEHAGTVDPDVVMRIRRSATASDFRPLLTISASEDVSEFLAAHVDLDIWPSR